MPAATTLMTTKIMMTQRYVHRYTHMNICILTFFVNVVVVSLIFQNVAEKQGGTINHWQVNIKYILYTTRHTIVSLADNDINHDDNLYADKDDNNDDFNNIMCAHTFIKCRLVTSMTDVLSIFAWHYVNNVRVCTVELYILEYRT